jgi:hypothetical protein
MTAAISRQNTDTATILQTRHTVRRTTFTYLHAGVSNLRGKAVEESADGSADFGLGVPLCSGSDGRPSRALLHMGEVSWVEMYS